MAANDPSLLGLPLCLPKNTTIKSSVTNSSSTCVFLSIAYLNVNKIHEIHKVFTCEKAEKKAEKKQGNSHKIVIVLDFTKCFNQISKLGCVQDNLL